MRPWKISCLGYITWLISLTYCKEDPRSVCLDGVQTAVTTFVFNGSTAEDYYGMLCANELCVTSLWAAAKLYCTSEEIEVGSETLAGYCIEYGMVELIPYGEVEPSLTDDFIAALAVVQYEDIDPTKIWNQSVLLSKALFEIGKGTVATFEYEYYLHQEYGWFVYGFWGIVVLVGVAYRVFASMILKRHRVTFSDVENTASKLDNASHGPHILWKTYDYVRMCLVIPSSFRSYHQRLFWWCKIPTRLETMVIVAYWIISFVLCCVAFRITWPNLYYPRSMQLCRYIADRTGIISYANLPVLWAFSGRNNVLLWLTGWQFSTFNLFHRHVARIATVQAIVHSICYTILELYYKEYSTEWMENYWYMGAMATTTMSLLLLLSSVWLRRHTYELFLIIHIVFGVITIVSLFYHTAIFEGEYDPYLWPLVAVWGFDRFLRLARLLFCNIGRSESGSWSTTTTIATYNEEDDLIRLDVSPGSCWLKPSSGQHYFLYSPWKWRGWENHPFTLAGWHSYSTEDLNVDLVSVAAGKDTAIEAGTGSGRDTAQSADCSETASLPPSPNADSPNKHHRTTFTFFIRPNNGWTKELRAHCITARVGVVKPHLLIEGPYGEHHPLHKFERVLIIVGGSGITAGLPYLQDYLERKVKRGSTRTRDITFIWTTRQAEMIRTLGKTTTLQVCANHGEIDAIFHTTSPEEGAAPAAAETGAHKSATSVIDGGGSSDFNPRIVFGRPDVRTAILSAANATSGSERLAVFTCGPAEMADQARAAVYDAMKSGKRQIEYFEENFGW